MNFSLCRSLVDMWVMEAAAANSINAGSKIESPGRWNAKVAPTPLPAAARGISRREAQVGDVGIGR